MDLTNPADLFRAGTDQLPLFAITDTMSALENSSGSGVKATKTRLLRQLFDLALDVEPMELAHVFMVFSCKVFPDYANRDFGIGNSMIYQLLSKISKQSESKLKKEMKKVGDLGTLGGSFRNSNPKTKDEGFSKLTFGHWFSQIRELSGISRVCRRNLIERRREEDQTANRFSGQIVLENEQQ